MYTFCIYICEDKCPKSSFMCLCICTYKVGGKTNGHKPTPFSWAGNFNSPKLVCCRKCSLVMLIQSASRSPPGQVWGLRGFIFVCVPQAHSYRILHHFWRTFTFMECLLESLLLFHRHFGMSLATLFASKNRLERQSCHRRRQGIKCKYKVTILETIFNRNLWCF